MPPRPFPLLPALALFLVGWAAIGWPWLVGRVVIPWDGAAHFYPQLVFLARALHAGESFLWAPNVFAGMPQIADPQSLIFSPPFFLLAALDPAPSLVAMSWAVLGTLALGGVGVLLYGRDRGWPLAAAVVAALVFAWGGSAAWRLQHVGQIISYAHLPLALWALTRALDRSSLMWGAIAGAVIGSMLISRDQVALLGGYALAIVAAWQVLGTPGRLRAIGRAFGPLLACALVGLAVMAVPVALTAAWAAESNRPAIDLLGAGRGSLHPALLLTLINANLFASAGEMANFWGPPSFHWPGTDLFTAQNMGVVYLGALPLIALAAGGLWARETRGLALAAAFALIYALGWFTPAFRLFYALLPGVDLFRRPADATFLLGGFLALLCGHALHRVLTAPRLDGARAALILLGLVALAAAVAAWRDRLSEASVPLATALACLAVSAIALLAARRFAARPLVAALLLGGVVAADLAWNNGPNGASGLPRAMYAALEPDGRAPVIARLQALLAASAAPDRRDRVELAGLGFHWPNAPLVHGFDATLGYNPLRSGLYSQATGAGDTIGLPDQRNFAPLMPSYVSPLADLLGLRFIAAPVTLTAIDPHAGALREVARLGEVRIYENPRALPRVRFATGRQGADFARLLRQGGWPEVEIATTVLLDPLPPGLAPRAPGGRASARLASYRNAEVVIETDADTDGIVVLHDLWHPWWTVDIDGVPAPLLRADVIFRGVAVPAGRHTVRFVFRPFRGLASQIAARRR